MAERKQSATSQAQQAPAQATPPNPDDKKKFDFDIEKFCKPHHKIGDTTFYFETMRARQAGRKVVWLTNNIRKYNLVEIFLDSMKAMPRGKTQAEENQYMMMAVGLCLTGIPEDFVDELEELLFPFVKFSNKTFRDKTDVVPGYEDAAFAGLEGDAYLEVLFRALCVNFRATISGIISLLE